MARIEDQVRGEDGVEIRGDIILEVILSQVPIIDLVPASRVCKSWYWAVTSSLRHHKRPKPWLILHKQDIHNPRTISMHAYDPRSHVWMKMLQRSIKCVSNLKSSHSKFLYMFSSLKLSFSFDPLNLTWSDVYPPFGSCRDPIVACVGNFIVIAGGEYEYESDPSLVEIYNIGTCAWQICDNMPRNLIGLSASAFLSIATTKEKLLVTKKHSSMTYWFDPKSKCWFGPYTLNPGQPIVDYNIGTSDCDLILVGLCKNSQNAERLKIWKVVGENFQCEEIGEMPCIYVEKLTSKSSEISSLNTCVIGNFVYIYNPLEMDELVVCELIIDGQCRWWSIQNVVAGDEIMNKLVFTCSEVGFEDLQRVMRLENQRLLVES
ncbi:F-box kelch-repeat At1g23390 [Olea europaea subsp. europaea]|uniref:F-box kelch-repeat At1g23390 n=1 Tax=Olea europaea subsp. europaea TaxID=158383 RepID=A0A8S0TM70_OLEEU|nr:F-box kelch-repeat At1g23390 [Olea europaea subsp. europaea]